MALEQLANEAQALLVADVTAGASTITVDSAATFPGVPQFRVRLDDELMLVTAVSGATFTVTRGIEGTTADAHASDTDVTHVLTKASLLQVIEDVGAARIYGISGVAHVTAPEIQNEATSNSTGNTREDQARTQNSAPHTLWSADLTATPNAGITLDVLVVGVRAGATCMQWFKKSRAWLNTAGSLTAGSQRNVDSELIGTTPPGTWTVVLDDDGTQTLRVRVNSGGDDVTWYVASQRLRVTPF
jgi:hypothetical protein